eukprot:11970694-Prorocentrum_lima.AAC.1
MAVPRHAGKNAVLLVHARGGQAEGAGKASLQKMQPEKALAGVLPVSRFSSLPAAEGNLEAGLTKPSGELPRTWF